MKKQDTKTKEIWNDVVTTFEAFAIASAQFVAQSNYTEILKQALVDRNRHVALFLLKDLSQVDIEACFDELVFLSSFSHGGMDTARRLLLSLPRNLILNRVEKAVEPILHSATYDEYRCVLELYKRLDINLMQGLALVASKNVDDDIKEVGEEYLRFSPHG